MLFGKNEISDLLLQCLGYTPHDIPRYRDCFLKEGKIIIHTRTGGGNRDFYDSLDEGKLSYKDYDYEGPWNSNLRSHPNYIEDFDDNFDATYANFFFSFPEEYKEDLIWLSNSQENEMPEEKWKILFNKLSELKK